MGFVVEGAPARRMSPSLSMISGGRLSFLSSSENAKVFAEGGTHIGKPFFRLLAQYLTSLASF